jgi:hypothetical protein
MNTDIFMFRDFQFRDGSPYKRLGLLNGNRFGQYFFDNNLQIATKAVKAFEKPNLEQQAMASGRPVVELERERRAIFADAKTLHGSFHQQKPKFKTPGSKISCFSCRVYCQSNCQRISRCGLLTYTFLWQETRTSRPTRTSRETDAPPNVGDTVAASTTTSNEAATAAGDSSPTKANALGPTSQRTRTPAPRRRTAAARTTTASSRTARAVAGTNAFRRE